MRQLASRLVNLSPLLAGVLGGLVATVLPSITLLLFFLSTSGRVGYDADSLYVAAFALRELFLFLSGFVAALLAKSSGIKVVFALGVVLALARIIEPIFGSGLQIGIGLITVPLNVLVLTLVGGFLGIKLRALLASTVQLQFKVLAVVLAATLVSFLAIIAFVCLSSSATSESTQSMPTPLMIAATALSATPLPTSTPTATLTFLPPTIPPSSTPDLPKPTFSLPTSSATMMPVPTTFLQSPMPTCPPLPTMTSVAITGSLSLPTLTSTTIRATSTPTITLVPSLVTSLQPVFVYPRDGQRLDYGKAYMFMVQPIAGADCYQWTFSQNNALLWDTIRDEKRRSGNEYAIFEGHPAHERFQPGSVRVTVRANINAQWTRETSINTYLQ